VEPKISVLGMKLNFILSRKKGGGVLDLGRGNYFLRVLYLIKKNLECFKYFFGDSAPPQLPARPPHKTQKNCPYFFFHMECSVFSAAIFNTEEPGGT
jgi:hypothetical protein